MTLLNGLQHLLTEPLVATWIALVAIIFLRHRMRLVSARKAFGNSNLLTFVADSLWIAFMVLVILGVIAELRLDYPRLELTGLFILALLGHLTLVIGTRKNSRSNHALILVVKWLWIAFLILVIVGFLAALPMKRIGLIVLTILVSLAVMAAIGALLPVKTTFTRSYVVKAVPEQIWAALSDRRDWRSGFGGIDELPPQDGHRRWVEHYEIGTKRTWEEAESTPPYKLVFTSANQLSYGSKTSSYVVEPVDEDSRLTIIDDYCLHNPIGRFFERYVATARNRELEYEAGRLQILVRHHTYSGRADLDDATLVCRDEGSPVVL